MLQIIQDSFLKNPAFNPLFPNKPTYAGVTVSNSRSVEFWSCLNFFSSAWDNSPHLTVFHQAVSIPLVRGLDVVEDITSQRANNLRIYASFWVRSEISWEPCPTHPSKPKVFGAPENVYSISPRQRANRLLLFQNKTFLWSKFRQHFTICKNCSCSTHGPDGQVCPSVSPGDALGITASRKKSQGKNKAHSERMVHALGPQQC